MSINPVSRMKASKLTEKITAGTAALATALSVSPETITDMAERIQGRSDAHTKLDFVLDGLKRAIDLERSKGKKVSK